MSHVLITVVAGLTFLCWPSAVAAQIISGGVKGGVSFADVPEFSKSIEREGIDADYRRALTAGGFVAFRITDAFAIQPEVLFTQRGLKSKSDIPATYKVDYIDVPVLVRVDVSRARGMYLVGGPSFDINIRAKIDQEEPSIDYDVKDETETFEMGIVAGVGFQIGKLLIEGRYVEGLTDSSRQASTSEASPTFRNRTFAAMVGVQFP